MKWFYTLKNHVKGPFSNQEFETALLTLGTDIKETLVWTRGKGDWTEAERWSAADADKIQVQAQSAAVMSSLANVKIEKGDSTKTVEVAPAERQVPTQRPQTAAPVAAASPAPIKPTLDLNVPAKKSAQPTILDVIMPTDDEITKLFGVAPTDIIQSVKENVDEKYKVQYNGAEQAPMTKAQLIEFTGRQEDPSLIMIFNKKHNDWKEIYTFPDIIEKLGLSRRQNRRVTLLANFKGQIKQTTDINARLTTISLGGFGLTDVFDLKISDTVKGQISSPHFYTPLAIEAEVTYAGAHGGIGLKFTSITDEARALVIDYIKKFGQGIKTEDI